MRLTRGRVSGLIVVIMALTIFFIIIDIYRRRSAKLHRDGAEPNDDLTMLCMKLL